MLPEVVVLKLLEVQVAGLVSQVMEVVIPRPKVITEAVIMEVAEVLVELVTRCLETQLVLAVLVHHHP